MQNARKAVVRNPASDARGQLCLTAGEYQNGLLLAAGCLLVVSCDVDT